MDSSGSATAGVSAAPGVGVRSAPTSPAVVQVTPEQAMSWAAERSPELWPRLAAHNSARQIGEAARSVLQRPPRVDIAVGPRRAPGGTTSVDASVLVSQDVSVGGYRAARRGFAAAFVDATTSRLELQRADAAARAGFAWVDARLARELERIRGDALRDARSLLQAAEARVAAGKSAPTERALARSVLGAAEASVLAAEGLRVTADTELRYVLGLPTNQELEPKGALDGPDSEAAPNASNVPSSTFPELTLARKEAQLIERSRELSLASGRPFISVGPSVTREGTGDWIVQAHLGVPLPFVNPAALEASELGTRAAAARAETARLSQELQARLRVQLHEREHARAVRDTLARGAVEPAQSALEQATLQYQAGSLDLVGVLTLRREMLLALEQWAEAAAAVRRADIELLRLTGRILGRRNVK